MAIKTFNIRKKPLWTMRNGDVVAKLFKDDYGYVLKVDGKIKKEYAVREGAMADARADAHKILRLSKPKRGKTPKRVFDGKLYVLKVSTTSRGQARGYADFIRKRGGWARVTGSGRSWAVWAR